MRPGRLIVALSGALWVLACLAWAGSALAHASLLAADPADGATVTSAPASLTLEFNEQVAPVVLRLIEPDGKGTALEYRLDGPRVVIGAPPSLADGTYALSWRVISSDGHPVGGTTLFSIGAPSRFRPPIEATPVIHGPVRIGIWLARLATYAGLFAGIGGVFFCRWIADRPTGLKAVRAALISGLVALPLSIGFQGLDVLGQPVCRFIAAATWQEGLSSTFGLFAAIAFAGLVLGLAASVRSPFARALALAALPCAGIALAATGHASTAEPQWLTRPAVFVHTSVAAFWIGALMPLAALLRGPAEPAAMALKRFSMAIPGLLALMLAAGLVLAFVQLGTPASLLDTAYGRVFVVKMALVAAVLGLAGFNRWRLSGAVLSQNAAASRRLAAAVAVETGLMLCILAVVALWRFTPPPRALLEGAAEPAFVHIHSDEAMVEITVTPGHSGSVGVAIHIDGADMRPLVAKGVTVDFANKVSGIEPIERAARPGSDGDWYLDRLTLPVGGVWQVSVAVLVTDFKEIDLAGEIDIRPDPGGPSVHERN